MVTVLMFYNPVRLVRTAVTQRSYMGEALELNARRPMAPITVLVKLLMVCNQDVRMRLSMFDKTRTAEDFEKMAHIRGIINSYVKLRPLALFFPSRECSSGGSSQRSSDVRCKEASSPRRRGCAVKVAGFKEPILRGFGHIRGQSLPPLGHFVGPRS
jgi:hypothetical protein